MDVAELRSQFESHFGAAPRIFSAPGRVNLIGDHTDYNDGFVLPFALDLRTYVAARARQDRRVRVRSRDLAEAHEFDLDEAGVPQRGEWTDYCEGVARVLHGHGLPLTGADLLIASEVPRGAGLSSSAALEIAVGMALLGVANVEIDRHRLAFSGQEAEHVYVGTQCGIMDQFISAFAVQDEALLLDCRSLNSTPVRLRRAEAVVIVCDTGVKHALASSAYNERRRECERAVELLRVALPQISHLRDVSVEYLGECAALLPPSILRRCRHVVTENARALAMAALLEQGALEQAGELMIRSHASLRDDYEVSCPELDVLVEVALRAGAWGARMTGGGFGGCTVNLVEPSRVAAVVAALENAFMSPNGRRPTAFVARPSAGAREE